MRRRTNITLLSLLLVLIVTIVVKNYVLSGPGPSPSIIDYTAEPPFIGSKIKPNLLLMIDNSASMYDLTYISSGTYCYDNTYDNTKPYEGYFTLTTWYGYTGGKFTGVASLPGGCTYQTPYLCVNMTGSGSSRAVSQFVASGRFLNWLSASKFDIQKKILTGGKYDTVNHVLIGESRGCVGRRFVKEIPGLSGITFAVRGPNALEPDFINPDTQGGYSRIEIYEGNYNQEACLSAVDEWINGNYGQASVQTKNCLGVSGGGGTASGRELATFNHSLQTCWLIKENIEKGRDLWQGVNTTDVEVACRNTYEKDFLLPSQITNERRGNYICTSVALHIAPPDPYDDWGSDTTGFVGKCWDGDFDNETCVKREILHYCSGVTVSEVIDPSEGVSDTGETWNIPAVLVDAGIRSVGNPIGLSGSTDTFFYVKVSSNEPTGLIQEFSDLIRIGVMSFNYNGSHSECNIAGATIRCPAGANLDGGKVISYIGDSVGDHSSGLINAIDQIEAKTWTPFAEAFYNAIGYFSNRNLMINPGDFDLSKNPSQYWCQDNFILLITDGLSTADLHSTVNNLVSSYNDGDGQIDSTLNPSLKFAGSRNLDDLAWLAQNRNIFNFNQNQDPKINNDNVTTQVVFSGKPNAEAGECNPETLMKQTASNGGGTYQRAESPEELSGALWEAFTRIAAKAASGTAISVLSTAGEGEGAIYQAYFYPRVAGTDLRWLGYLQALFVDTYGNIREDTNGNKRLDNDDYIVRMWFDETEKRVMIDRFRDMNGNGILDCVDTNNNGRLDTCNGDQKVDTLLFDEIRSIWEAGKLLFSRDPDSRKIYTTIDGSTFLAGGFTDSNASALEPYLRAIDTTEAAQIINYIRGDDISGYRSRTLTISGETNTWKLGDIIHSTPTAVAKPMENYDLLYGNQSYYDFRKHYLERRHVIYVGANDGMLHALNGGFYDVKTRGFTGGGHELGEELWAFIPRELLPHLKWLTDPNYTHVYYVDLKPKVTDVRIFNNDDIHPGGWGTILIGGMRYGGKAIPTDAGTFRSTYFALDITDPERPPRLLWTFDTTDSGATDLGLTMSYPAVVKVENEWYVVFGSGPINFDSLSNLTGFQKGKIFALKISGSSNGVISSWAENTNYWRMPTPTASMLAFMSNPITTDVDSNFNFDALYIGENYHEGGEKRATMWRLNTGERIDAGSWSLSALYNIDNINDKSKRITASPSAAIDEKWNLWIYFGTGQFIGAEDANTADTGAFYGIKDRCWNGSCSTTYSSLLDVTDAAVYWGGGNVSGVAGVSNWSQLLGAASDGWAIYFNNMPAHTTDFLGNIILHQGERVTTKPAIIGGLVMFSSYVPSTDMCECEGTSNFYALYYETGTAYKEYVFWSEKELKGTGATQTVSGVAYLGRGLPTSIGLTVTREGKLIGFIQSSTGEIQPIEDIIPDAPRSGYVSWKYGGFGGL